MSATETLRYPGRVTPDPEIVVRSARDGRRMVPKSHSYDEATDTTTVILKPIKPDDFAARQQYQRAQARRHNEIKALFGG